jgi:glycosyltransferase involved in cell wall biosynthesis
VNILTFNYEYPPLGGGGGIVHALVAEELARRHRVHVITSAFGDLPPYEVRQGVEIHRVPVLGRNNISAASLSSLLSYPPAAWLRAALLTRRQTFDIINSHFAVPTGPGSLPPAKLARIPHVLSLHGGDIYDPSKRLSPHRLPGVRWTVASVLRNSDAVVAQSTNTRDNVYRFYKYRGPIEIIPLGIRQPEVTRATRDQLGLPRDVFLGVTVGRLVKRKGIDRLLEALARSECSRVHLVVVGDGPEREPLQGLSDGLGLGNRVMFMGRVEEEEKWQILHCADAYLSATLHEGFGLVYLEAMAAGLPIVTADHGGQVDFLRDGETGYLVPAGDTAAMAGAIARLAAHPEMQARLGESNLSRSTLHRIEHCAREYEALFGRVVDDVARNGRGAQRHSSCLR